MKAIKHLSIGLKLNIVLIVTFALLVISTTLITSNSVKRLALQVSDEHVKQEIERIQNRFLEAEQQLAADAQQLASDGALVNALDKQSRPAIEDVLAQRASFTSLSYIEVVGTDQTVVAAWQEADLAGSDYDRLVEAALADERSTTETLINEQDEQIAYWLVSATPIYDEAEQVVGALVGARKIDEQFVNTLQLGSDTIQIALINNSRVLAHNLLTVSETTDNIEMLDEASIARGYQVIRDADGRAVIITNDADSTAGQASPYRPEEVLSTLVADPAAEAALNGTVMVGKDFVQGSDGSTSTRVGYAPLMLSNGEIPAAVAIMIPEDNLFEFQEVLLDNTIRVYTLFPLIVLGVLAIFAQQTIAHRLKKLRTVTAKMTSGDYSQRSTDDIMDEIGELAEAFNQMSTRVQMREGDLRELADTLEHQVQERTAELRKQATTLLAANHELAQSRKQAEEASRLKNEFLATMSHELRTPLNAIIGFTQIILAGMTGDLNDEQREYHRRIFSNSQNLMGLINDILDLSKIEAGRLELVLAPFNLRHWVNEINNQVSGLASQKSLALEIEVSPNLPEELVGDADRIKQIMLNLLSNAIKFTEKGSVEVNINKLDATWLIEVKDTGIGIPSHALEYIFDEFRQVDGSARRNYGGTGLGLAIVRNLARMMDGSVRVKSEVGKGSVFTVVLPLITVSTPVNEPVSDWAQ